MKQEKQIDVAEVQLAAERLSGHDDFQLILGFLTQEKERFFADLRQSETPNDVMKLTGSISNLQELLDILG